jgi:replicative DNA helicase
MANWQHAFLSRVVLDESIKEAVDAGITVEFFRDPGFASVYDYMLKHWGKYATAPDAAVVHQAFPSITWTPQTQPLTYLIDRMRHDRKLVILMNGLKEASEYVHDENADEMQGILQRALTTARLETSEALDEDFTAQRTAIEEMLLTRMDDPGRLRGISTGFHGIDYVTGGFQPEQFIVLLGTPKSFKSATLLAMARAVHAQAKLPLFIGYEMSNSEQIDRLLSLISGVGLNKIINGTLNHKEYRAVQQALSLMEGMLPFVFSTDITAATTVGGVQAKVQNYQPDVVFVDGAYLMQSELERVEPGSPQAITNISRSLKRLAQSHKLPVVVTTQASLPRSKGGLTIGSAMYTQAWGQDCDVMLGVERVVDDERKEPADDSGVVLVKFKVIDSRSGPRKETLLEWDWNKGSVREIDAAKVKASIERSKRGYSYEDDGDD